jgi:hypothetical protein
MLDSGCGGLLSCRPPVAWLAVAEHYKKLVRILQACGVGCAVVVYVISYYGLT